MMLQNHGMGSGKMKINGQEVDMQKVVAQFERELPKRKKPGASNQLWWGTQAGMIQKEKLSARLREMHSVKEIHCHKIKYNVTDIKTNEETKIEGQLELAQFLGYKSFNSQLRNQYITTKQLSNKSKTNTYEIKEIL